MKAITKINRDNENAYEGLRNVINYMNNADDMGWAFRMPTIQSLLELYDIEYYELDNGGLFSESGELIEMLAEKKHVSVEEIRDNFNKRIGVDIF